MGIGQKFLDEFNYFGDRIYLDCSAMGMQPMRTRNMAKRHLDDFYDSLWRDPSVQGELIRAEARDAVAELIHADPADVFFTRNTTEGNSLLVQGYPLEPGDEVLVCNEDFPSVYLPFAPLQKKGIVLTVVPGSDGIVDADDLIARFTDRTRVVAVSMAQSSSGYVIDLPKLGAACHERGILLSVDAVQAAGRLPINVETLNADVLAASGFKGLMGIMGAGFCWCRREVMDRIEPPVVCDNIDRSRYELQPGFTELPVPVYPSGALRMETGTTNNLGIAMLGESVRMINEIGIGNIAAQIRSVETYYRECLKKADLEIRMLGSDDPRSWSGSVSFLYDTARKVRLDAALEKAGIYASVRNYFRVSFHFYNITAHVDRLMEVLKKTLK